MEPLVAVARGVPHGHHGDERRDHGHDQDEDDDDRGGGGELVAAELERVLAEEAGLKRMPQIKPLAKGVLKVVFAERAEGQRVLACLHGRRDVLRAGVELRMQEMKTPTANSRKRRRPGAQKDAPGESRGEQSFREVEAFVGDHEQIQGLRLVPDLVSVAEEQALMAQIDEAWETPVHRHQPKNRRVRHFGFRFDYGTRRCDKSKPVGPFPAWLAVVAHSVRDAVRAMPAAGLAAWEPEQATANEYLPGQGIPPHVDTHSAFTDGLASLSLGAPSVMRFCPEGHRDEPIDVLLPPRSLVIMTGEARFRFTHGILQRKSDPIKGRGVVPRGTRVSLTFRMLKASPACSPCPCPEMCDLVPTESQEESDLIETGGAHSVTQVTACFEGEGDPGHNSKGELS